jgi:CheY-like chemotaxis protein
MSDGGNFRVLVVDDDEIAVAAISYVLAEAGCAVTRLATPIGVTQIVLAQNIDVVILDLQMPALRGDKLAMMLRGNKRLKDVPVVLVSAAPEQELRTICRSIPGVVALPKRRMQNELAKLVHELAVKKRAAVNSERGLEVGASIVPQAPSIPPAALPRLVFSGAGDGSSREARASEFVARLPRELVAMTKLWRETSYGVTHSQLELLKLLEQLNGECQSLPCASVGAVLSAIEELVKALRPGARAPGSASVSVLAALNSLTRIVRDGPDAMHMLDAAPITNRLGIERERLNEAGASGADASELARQNAGGGR